MSMVFKPGEQPHIQAMQSDQHLDSEGERQGEREGEGRPSPTHNHHDEDEDRDEDEDEQVSDEGEQVSDEDEDEDDDDDHDDGQEDEYIVVNLATIREEMQCPICLGIIRKTRTVMECLHRFCRDCIDKSMRMGNNECPACRTHCASRRSLRDDPNYDALIAALYPDIDKYEEEELAMHEEEELRNRHIQASIADTVRRQSEAITRRRRSAKATDSVFVRKVHDKLSSISGQSRANNRVKTRTKRNRKSFTNDGVCGDQNQQHSDDQEPEEHRWAQKRRRVSTALNADVADEVGNEDHEDTQSPEHSQADASRGSADGSPNNARNAGLSWGKGGARSHMKYTSVRGAHGKNSRSIYAAKMVDYLLNKKYQEDDSEFDIQFMLQPLENEEKIPCLKRPYLCCRRTLTVKQICKFLSRFCPVTPEGIEIIIEKNSFLNSNHHGTTSQFSEKLPKEKSSSDNSDHEKHFEVLNQEMKLEEIFVSFPESRGNLVLMYRSKV